MPKFYFTFSCGIDDPHRNCYTVIEAEDFIKARELMIEKFGTHWCFQYTEEEWVYDPKNPQYAEMCVMAGYHGDQPISQAEIWNLKEIK